MTSHRIHQAAQFWNASAEDFDSIYTGANKPLVGRFLDQVFRRDIYERFVWVMDRCGDLAGKAVCDIGCGPGHFVAEFAKRGAAQVTGVDIAPNMLKLARERVQREGVAHRCEFVLSDTLTWSPVHKFDVSIAIGFWDYIRDPSEHLRRIRQVTTGTFLSAWPRRWTWRMPIRKLRLQYMLGYEVYFYRKAEVMEKLRNAGFEVIRCETVGKLFCVEARAR